VAHDVQFFDVRAWQPGAGWTTLPSQGVLLPATGLELRLRLRDGRGPLSYRRVLEL
jgi:general secretion pathway protein J